MKLQPDDGHPDWVDEEEDEDEEGGHDENGPGTGASSAGGLPEDLDVDALLNHFASSMR